MLSDAKKFFDDLKGFEFKQIDEGTAEFSFRKDEFGFRNAAYAHGKILEFCFENDLVVAEIFENKTIDLMEICWNVHFKKKEQKKEKQVLEEKTISFINTIPKILLGKKEKISKRYHIFSENAQKIKEIADNHRIKDSDIINYLVEQFIEIYKEEKGAGNDN